MAKNLIKQIKFIRQDFNNILEEIESTHEKETKELNEKIFKLQEYQTDLINDDSSKNDSKLFDKTQEAIDVLYKKLDKAKDKYIEQKEAVYIKYIEDFKTHEFRSYLESKNFDKIEADFLIDENSVKTKKLSAHEKLLLEEEKEKLETKIREVELDYILAETEDEENSLREVMEAHKQKIKDINRHLERKDSSATNENNYAKELEKKISKNRRNLAQQMREHKNNLLQIQENIWSAKYYYNINLNYTYNDTDEDQESFEEYFIKQLPATFPINLREKLLAYILFENELTIEIDGIMQEVERLEKTGPEDDDSLNFLNKNYRDKAVQRYENTLTTYKYIDKKLIRNTEIFAAKKEEVKSVIDSVNEYVNSIANKPKEIVVELEELKIAMDNYENIMGSIETEINELGKKEKLGATAGLIGTGIGVGGANALMWIATTFGKASTGTAISTLSGAAATKASLAWLGGGALTAGGAGMAAGKVLTTLAGPVGWTIGGASIIGTAFSSSRKNKDLAADANKQTALLEAEIKTRKTWIIEIKELFQVLENDKDNLNTRLNEAKTFPNDFNDFTEEQIYLIGSLLNINKAATENLFKVVGVNTDTDDPTQNVSDAILYTLRKHGTKGDSRYFKDNIPSKIKKNAIEKYGNSADDKILYLRDDSILSNGKHGYMLTDKRLYASLPLQHPFTIDFTNLKNIEIDKDEKSLLIIRESYEKEKIKFLNEDDLSEIGNLSLEILNNM